MDEGNGITTVEKFNPIDRGHGRNVRRDSVIACRFLATINGTGQHITVSEPVTTNVRDSCITKLLDIQNEDSPLCLRYFSSLKQVAGFSAFINLAC